MGRTTEAPRTRAEVVERPRTCPLYKVLLHNDDVTPFEFVQHAVCEGVFRLGADRARVLTQEVHRQGIGLAGVYPLEQAEFKCEQTVSLARGRGYPLRVTFEPA